MPTSSSESRELAGRTVFLAGAGRNNGRAIALAFAKEGANLVLVSRKRKESLERVGRECEELGAATVTLLADLTDEDAVDRAVQVGRDAFGMIDTLISVLAIRPHKSVIDTTVDEWNQVFAVNVDATFLLAKALISSMIEEGFGNIVALGGVSSLRALPNRPGVNASKFALYGLIQSIALDFGGHGIRANMVAPGFIRNHRLDLDWYPEAVDGTPHSAVQIDRTPLRREGSPEEVAQVVLFLASDRSSFITGDCLVCAGGRQI
jgi:3-oxoacyl-[acyl-carrier protein] reductase